MNPNPIIIIGAGPAGLTAAYQLSKNGRQVIVLEADPDYVGGISRTIEHSGFRFDIGGHRFYTKSKEVDALWDEMLPEPGDMLTRQRCSRIFYRNRFFSYPLAPMEALLGLGLIETIRCGLSYLKARLKPNPHPANFAEWVSNEFGERLFTIFFKTYTEKVWGMPCTEISADWAAQRIKGLNLSSTIKAAIRPAKKDGQSIKTLIKSFRYPRLGPGMLWEACADKIRANGGQIIMGKPVVSASYQERDGWTIHTADGESYRGEHIISTAAIYDLGKILGDQISASVLDHASALRYRDFLTVALIVEDSDKFPDQWIYIHEPEIQAGRIQNYRSWSPDMVPDATLSCYGMEYFCFESDDGLWSMSDQDLGELAARELVHLGLAEPEQIRETVVVRQAKAYPVYDDDYAHHVAEIRKEIQQTLPNLHLIGRNGMHKYNNQDHSMMTACLCVDNILADEILYDLWQVNEDATYGESDQVDHSISGLRQVPRRVTNP